MADMASLRLLIVVGLCLVPVSCAKATEQKLAWAQEVLDDAKAAGATEYAKADLGRAEDLFYTAFNAIQDEKRRFWFLRNYKNADRCLDSGIHIAQRAIKTAEIAKLKMEEAANKSAAERAASFRE